MPELPEVETIVRDLRPLLVGKRIRAVSVGQLSLRRRWENQWKDQIVGRTVRAVTRRGKWILIDLGNPWLLVHLGMTGQFRVHHADAAAENHTHFIFSLGPKEELRFRDVRRFGSISLFSNRQELDQFFTERGLGPEPFDLEKAYWKDRLSRAKRSLKAFLLDQCVVAGVGNIYADESLFQARIHPTILACNLPARKAEQLRQAVVEVLERAIVKRGSTIRDYIGGSGLRGGFQKEFCVYGRGGEPCPRCGTAIQVIRLAGRSTHFCPKCQKAGK